MTCPYSTLARWRRPLGTLTGLLLLLLPAWAQYKVVGPDGSVTYTDRPPVEAGAKVQAMRRDGSLVAPPAGGATTTTAAAPGPATPTPGVANLPTDLRALVARFPVTLYISSDCAPCLQGRSLLAQRGVPYSERLVTGDDDIAALQRLTGGRSVPALTIGGQALRGFQDSDWQAMLDLAGYPRESRLPRGWQAPPASALVARNAPSRSDPADSTIRITGAPAAGAGETPVVTPAPAASAGIRF